ncbi:hypothetical protein BOX15_Mlig029044g1 [Macrostomum lignano]|uniref:Uncharacterized protein n=1 Tax=Macrostomum lignano TaxID=282301 RepID=A0A267DB07_9PLAT|nr:hypothetical protein BOX15_Mlig029044g1 [Macrostomum lignano]
MPAKKAAADKKAADASKDAKQQPEKAEASRPLPRAVIRRSDRCALRIALYQPVCWLDRGAPTDLYELLDAC